MLFSCIIKLKKIVGVIKGIVIVKNCVYLEVLFKFDDLYKFWGIFFNVVKNISIDELNC